MDGAGLGMDGAGLGVDRAGLGMYGLGLDVDAARIGMGGAGLPLLRTGSGILRIVLSALVKVGLPLALDFSLVLVNPGWVGLCFKVVGIASVESGGRMLIFGDNFMIETLGPSFAKMRSAAVPVVSGVNLGAPLFLTFAFVGLPVPSTRLPFAIVGLGLSTALALAITGLGFVIEGL